MITFKQYLEESGKSTSKVRFKNKKIKTSKKNKIKNIENDPKISLLLQIARHQLGR